MDCDIRTNVTWNNDNAYNRTHLQTCRMRSRVSQTCRDDILRTHSLSKHEAPYSVTAFHNVPRHDRGARSTNAAHRAPNRQCGPQKFPSLTPLYQAEAGSCELLEWKWSSTPACEARSRGSITVTVHSQPRRRRGPGLRMTLLRSRGLRLRRQ
jgi:hypothetical protein